MNNNYTNFWNDIQVNNGVVDEDFVKPKVDYIALAGYRRAIANFVNIVTNRSDIKVRYQQNGDSYTDGKTVTVLRLTKRILTTLLVLPYTKAHTFYYLTSTS